MMKQQGNHNSILLFDGQCNLCNTTVQFILNNEKYKNISFASLQSKQGVALLTNYNINTLTINSIVFIENEKAYTKSTAALRLTKNLKGIFPALQLFLIVPAFIRNFIYDFIAKNRYKWYGKTESCMLPEKNNIHRFL